MNAPGRPSTLTVAAVLFALQTLGFVALAVVLGIEAAGDAQVRSATAAVAAFAVVFAAAVAVLAWGAWRTRRWVRGPGAAWSILVALAGASQIAVNLWAALGLIVLGALTLFMLVARDTSRALGVGEDLDEAR